MKNNLFKRAIATAGAICCSVCLFATPAASMSVQAASVGTISGEATVGNISTGGGNVANPNADIKRWKYKEEDGKLWKRLWNGTKYRWEGDWIYVRDL